MLTADQIRTKVFRLVEEFERYYAMKNYQMAKSCYDKALAVATFTGMNEEDMRLLFLNKADEDEQPDWTGGFNQDEVKACYRWCIQHGVGLNESRPFPAIKKP